MGYRNTKCSYGIVARALHWGMAAAILAMFALGVWMRTLGYYDPWYKIGPDIHRSVGIVLLVLLAARFFWKLVNPQVEDHNLPRHERLIADIIHWAFYLLLLIMMVAGYLISTADGRGIEVFGLITVPSVYQSQTLPDIAGFIHEYAAYLLMAMVALHAAAALKHHFIDRDQTLTRMLGVGTESNLEKAPLSNGVERT